MRPLEKRYHVYIMTNSTHRVLYTGVTGDLRGRIPRHQAGHGSGFTSKYKARKLVYTAEFSDVRDAIAWEKKIKAGSRRKKLELIREQNPEWLDLGESL